jgi:hypothetical protein
MLQVNHPPLIAKDFSQKATLSPRARKHSSIYLGLALLLLGLGAVAASAFFDAKRPFIFDVSAPTP